MLVQCYKKSKEYNSLMHCLNGCNQTITSLIKAVSFIVNHKLLSNF